MNMMNAYEKAQEIKQKLIEEEEQAKKTERTKKLHINILMGKIFEIFCEQLDFFEEAGIYYKEESNSIIVYKTSQNSKIIRFNFKQHTLGVSVEILAESNHISQLFFIDSNSQTVKKIIKEIAVALLPYI